MALNNRLCITRLNRGEPIIQADPDGWDNRFTLNPTALYLERSPGNDTLIHGLLNGHSLDDPLLQDGVVVIYYRGIPKDVPGLPCCRSSVGLSVFTPDLHFIRRLPYPVLTPSDNTSDYDYSGVEDQRITRIGDTFYLLYCGFVTYPNGGYKAQICMAASLDLLNWEKLGPVAGDVNDCPNKDAALLPQPVNGNYIMLHRPSAGQQSDFCISLAVSDSPIGVWRDCGSIMKAVQHPMYVESWVGIGSTPIHLGDNVYLADYHTGNYLESGARDYFANYALLDFRKFDTEYPERIVEWRTEAVLIPETNYELKSPWPHEKTLNCVFPCGSYEFNGDIYLIYGGADAYVLAARLNKEDLLGHRKGIFSDSNRHVWAADYLREYYTGS